MKNRWIVALAGTVVMICLGTVYSWSTFTQPLIASFGWSNTTTTWTFAITILFLGIGSIIGGRWQDQAGPRPVVVTGAILWGIGNILAGFGTARFGAWWIYLTYGVIGGIGLGLGYITPVAVVTKWFPDKRGLASGMVVMGFGLGAFFYNYLLKVLPAFTELGKQTQIIIEARAAKQMVQLDPPHVHILMMTFLWSGIVYLVVGGLCAMYLSNPSTQATATSKSVAPSTDFTPAMAMQTWQFYVLWMMLFLNVTAGILFISNAVPIMRELTGITQAKALATYGFLALFNGLGRFFWGAISDRTGRRLAYVLIYGTQVAIFFSVGHLHSLVAVAALFAIVLLDYGGGFGTMPSFTADYYGTKFMGLIYGWILLAWGVGGVVGPIFVAKVKDRTGSFIGALPVIAVILIIALILPIIIRKPTRTEPEGFAESPATT
jgi:MFS family permease